MITRADIVERVHEWGLTEQVIEKDYILGWLLWGLALIRCSARSEFSKVARA